MNLKNQTLKFALLCFFACGLIPATFSQTTTNQTITSFNKASFRFIGPAYAGGRISDIEVFPQQTDHILISAASGGIFKSTDGTKTWIPVFDQAGNSLAIGDMDIADSNPAIVWAGTGEASGEQSAASIGDGVYKSLDAGLSWTKMGLQHTRHISRICIDPNDPETVYVAATGSRWGESEDRGVFKTTDGGNSWKKILFVNSNTGFGDLTLHPNGKIIIASAWFQRRSAWAHVRTGPPSGLYRSEDGGETWERLDVFKEEPIGRIALWMAPSDPNRVYACLESDTGGLYQSDDAGKTWKLVNEKLSTSYWYGRICGNPVDPNHLFIMGTNVAESTNGGKSVSRMKADNVHVDHHELWINPENTMHRLLGNDGGLYLTSDGGENWTFVENLGIGQNYAITVDNQDPYWIYGGLQDNGVRGGPSQLDGDLLNYKDLRWVAGGDGFWSAVHPLNPDIVYGESQYGYLVRNDFRDGTNANVRPRPDSENPQEQRFNWNTPFFISVHPPHALYLGGNFLYKSTDEGKGWLRISADLSKNEDLSKILVLDQKPVIKPYATITALAESPVKPGFLLAGTDDGKLHLSLDDGGNWTDLSDRLPAPADRFFTRVLWSVSDLKTAYVAFARYYEADDLSPWLFKTTDLGKTWELITDGFPAEAVIKGLCEHPDHPDLLFAGSHNALYISLNAGRSWFKPDWEIPPVAIDDIKLAFPSNDLVLGSYGRGIIILDNIGWISMK